MKVLAVNGSPRKKGNTQVLMEAAADELRKAGAEVEMISITEFDIRPCTGCRRCYEKLWDCPIGDDAIKVLKKIAYSDGILVGSPVYFGGVTAQLKALFDRSIMPYQVLDFSDKVGGAITVGGSTHGGQELAALQIASFFMCHDMIIATTKGEVLGGMATANDLGEAKKDVQGLESARNLGIRMAKLMKKR